MPTQTAGPESAHVGDSQSGTDDQRRQARIAEYVPQPRRTECEISDLRRHIGRHFQDCNFLTCHSDAEFKLRKESPYCCGPAEDSQHEQLLEGYRREKASKE